MVGGRKRDRFFYGSLLAGTEQAPKGSGDGLVFDARLASNVIAAVGVRRWFADIEAGRIAEGGGILGSVLTYAAREGFGDFMALHGKSFDTAHEFRNRFLISFLKGISGG